MMILNVSKHKILFLKFTVNTKSENIPRVNYIVTGKGKVTI